MPRSEPTDSGQFTFSQRSKSSAGNAIEAIAMALIAIRPQAPDLNEALATLAESIDFDISRLSHSIEVEGWKDHMNTERLEALRQKRDEFSALAEVVDDQIFEKMIKGLSDMMDSIKKVESYLQDQEPVGA